MPPAPLQIHSILKYGPIELITILGTYLPSSSNFFLNLIMFRALVYVPMRLVIPHPAARFYILRQVPQLCASVPGGLELRCLLGGFGSWVCCRSILQSMKFGRQTKLAL